MEALKTVTTTDVRLTQGEYTVLVTLHQELVDRDLCPSARSGGQRDLTELAKYLEFLPERPCKTIVGELRNANEIKMEGHGIETTMIRFLPEGTWCLGITGTEELVEDIANQLCSGSHFIYKGSQRNSKGIRYRVFARLERPIGGEGSP